MINSVTLWRIDPATLSPPGSGKRKISGGPLIDLARLQEAIRAGQVTEDSVDVVNRSCDDNLDDLRWTLQDILDCLLCAMPSDFKGAEWCETSWAGQIPCDAYSIPYDDTSRCRARDALEFYLKFSVDAGGALRIQMVRAHLSR